VGAALVAVSYVLGTLNRWRERGPGAAVVAASGLAGFILYLALGLVVLGVFWDVAWLLTIGWVLGLVGLVLILVGLLLRGEEGSRGARVAGAVVELFDAVVRIGTNAISFTRLAAFGLTHAAIGSVVWSATAAAWGAGIVGRLGAVLVFAVGNALAFALEALVVGVQALRLEYYELFSRILVAEGRPFAPWHVPIQSEERS
jgi:V/A-type H+-transporting ATPase subunit I